MADCIVDIRPIRIPVAILFLSGRQTEETEAGRRQDRQEIPIEESLVDRIQRLRKIETIPRWQTFTH
jgi:hypothetical protein